MDELKRGGIQTNIANLTRNISYVINEHGQVYNELITRVRTVEPAIFVEMNVNNFGRVMAYLTFVYLMKTSEDMMREAVRLVVPCLKEINITYF